MTTKKDELPLEEKAEIEQELQTVEETPLAVIEGIGIEGLEDVSPAIIPIPFLKLVQPTSQNVEVAPGKDADPGTFFYSDTKEAKDVVAFSLLKAKQGVAEFERNGQKEKSARIAILGYDLETEKKFVITLSVMSFSNFGSLVARLKQAKITKAYEYEITMLATKQENEKGKYYTVEFQLGNKLDDKLCVELSQMKDAYGAVLNRTAPEEVIETGDTTETETKEELF